MNLIEQLNELDTKLFLFLNGLHSPFFDPIMYWVSNKWIWIPFYLLIFILIIKDYKKRSILIFICIALIIALSDQLASHLIKPLVGRYRPSHAPNLEGLVHLSLAGAGGLYGFVSSHAANSFSLFVFLSYVLHKNFRWLKYTLAFWAILVCYSRIYVGVHYPGDILCGAILGSIIGYLIALFYQWLNHRQITTKFL